METDADGTKPVYIDKSLVLLFSDATPVNNSCSPYYAVGDATFGLHFDDAAPVNLQPILSWWRDETSRLHLVDAAPVKSQHDGKHDPSDRLGGPVPRKKELEIK